MKLPSILLVFALIFSGSVFAQLNEQSLNGGASTSKNVRDLQKVDDMQISRSIHDMIVADQSLSQESKNISVMTDSGVVILKGKVPSTAERSRIEELAKRAPGVRSVQNMTEIAGERTY